MNRNITSADSTLIMIIENLYPAGIKFEQYSTDSAFAMGDEEYAETRMGVDWYMVAGAINNPKQITVTLEPSSPTIPYLEAWMRAERTNKKKYWCSATINIPSLQKTFVFKNGVIKAGKMMPDANRTLQPRSYVFDFESVE